MPASISVLLSSACHRLRHGQCFNILREWVEEGSGRVVAQKAVYTDELDCFPPFFSEFLTGVEGLLYFYFLMKAPGSPSFFQLLVMIRIFCTSVELPGTRASHLNHISFVSFSHAMLNERLVENPLSNYSNRIIITIVDLCTYRICERKMRSSIMLPLWKGVAVPSQQPFEKLLSMASAPCFLGCVVVRQALHLPIPTHELLTAQIIGENLNERTQQHGEGFFLYEAGEH